MASIKELVPNVAQSEIRENINYNFKQTALKPEEKTDENKLSSIVGVKNLEEQQLYKAKDGIDYLSPETGVSKDGGSQQINGDLTCNGLNVTTNGAIIKDHLIVQDPNGEASFSVQTDKHSLVSGLLDVIDDTTLHKNLQVLGSITNNQENSLGKTTFTELSCNGKVTGYDTYLTFLRVTNNTELQKLSVLGDTSLRNLNINGNVSVIGRITFGNAPGSLGDSLVRPMHAGPSDVGGYLTYGSIYAQY